MDGSSSNSGTSGVPASDDGLSGLDGWNPLEQDYRDPNYNKYGAGPAAGRHAPCLPDQPKPESSAIPLYVSGIHMEMTEDGIRNLFTRAGKVTVVNKCTPKKDFGTNSTFGFVHMSNMREAIEAIDMFNQKTIGGVRMIVKVAKSQEEKEKERRQKEQEQGQLFHNKNSSHHSISPKPESDANINGGAKPQTTSQIGGGRQSPHLQLGVTGITSQSTVTNDVSTTITLDGAINERKVVHGPVLNCTVCEKPCKCRCPQCKTPYCSQDCQTKDWNTHKAVCKQRKNYHDTALEERFEIVVNNETVNCPDLSTPAAPLKEAHIEVCEPGVESVETSCAVIVSHVETPVHFHLNLMDNYPALLELLSQLNQVYSIKAVDNTFRPSIGAVCVAQFREDDNWYRARILAKLSPSSVHVLYVDFGNSEELDYARLRAIHPEHLQLKLQGVECRLAGVATPAGGWDTAANAQLSTNTPGYMACAAPSSAPGYIQLIGPDGSDVATEFVNSGIAVRQAPIVATCPAPASTILPTPNPPDHIVHTVIDLPLAVSDVHTMHTAAARLVEGSKATVTVVDAESPSCFWVQVFTNNEPALQQLQDLQVKLQDEYATRKATHGYKSTHFNYVVAPFDEDGLMYRAQVIKFGIPKVTVRYVDFGNIGLVEPAELHSLESPFMTLQFQAVCCKLPGVVGTAVDGAYAREAVAAFHADTFNKQMTALVVKADSWSAILDLEVDDTSLARTLIASGHACAVPTDMAVAITAVPSPTIPPSPTPCTASDISVAPPATPPTANPPIVAPVVTSSSGAQPTMASTLPLKTLPTQTQPVQVIVTDAGSPDSISVQLLCAQEEAADLSSKLQVALVNSTPYTPKVVDELISAKFSQDALWYRATIKQLLHTSAVVSFIDYGNVEEVSSSELRKLPDTFLCTPVQSIRCTLAGVCLAPAMQWDPVLVPTFQEVTLLVAGTDDGLPQVDIVDVSGESVIQTLLAAGVLTPRTPPAPSASPPTVAAPDVLSCTLASSETSHSFVPHSIMDVTLGTETEGIILEAAQPGIFHMQVVHDDTAATLETIMQSLAQQYSGYKAAYLPQLGELVAAKFEDDQWYRGQVVELASDCCGIKFLDFGNIDKVVSSRLAPLSSDLMGWPSLAVPCTLDGTCLVAGTHWDSALIPKDIYMTVKWVSRRDDVYMVDVQQKEGGSLRDVLLLAGVIALPEPPAPRRTTKPKLSSHPAPYPSSNIIDIQCLPSCDISDGMRIDEIVPMSVETPTLFYAQSWESLKLLEKLQNDLQMTGPNLRRLSEPDKGMVVVAQNPHDSSWYRAQILALRPNEARVAFIDYGDRAVVPQKTLREIDGSLLKLPKQAIPFCVDAIDGTEIENTFSEQSLNMFRKEVVEQKMCVRGAQWVGDKYIICDIEHVPTELPGCMGDGQPCGSVITKALATGLIKRGSSALPQSTPTLATPASPAAVTSASRSPDLDSRAVVATPPVSTPPVTYHDVASTEVIDSTPCIMAKQVAPSELVDGVTVTVIDVTSIQYFHVISMDELTQNNLTLVHTALNEGAVSLPPYGPCVGELVTGLFEECWYRAEVLANTKPELADLLFIDYGNTAACHHSNIQALGADFASVPRLAIPCALVGQWPPHADILFKDTVANKQFQVKLAGVNDGVTLVDLVSVKGSVADLMTEQLKQAKPVEEPTAVAPSPMPSTPPVAATPSIRPPSSLSDLPSSALPATFQCAISHADGPLSFYVQLPDEGNTNELQLRSEATQTCKNLPANTEFQPVAGELCLAKFNEDDSWYRSVVLRTRARDGMRQVRFIDFGNVQNCELATLYPLPLSHLTLAAQAHHCVLDGIADATPDVCIRFEELSAGLLSATLVKTESISYNVKLQNESGVDLKEALSAASASSLTSSRQNFHRKFVHGLPTT